MGNSADDVVVRKRREKVRRESGGAMIFTLVLDDGGERVGSWKCVVIGLVGGGNDS